ncbi:MAG TPA: transcriptional repressor LexA [Clostridia bacterium]
MERRPLDPKDEKVLEYLKKYITKYGYPPTVREICKALNITSTATAHYTLNRLQAYGYIRKVDNHKRALEIVNEYSDFPKKELVEVPLVGKITAGAPITAIENIEDVFPLPLDMFASGELFLLTVKGDSMINAGILDGDKIVVRKQSIANNGEIVAVLIDGEATVKRFYMDNTNRYIKLMPENDKYEPIIVEEAEILGLVVGLIRKY